MDMEGEKMINRPPKHFTYNQDTENLFLFYQRINEAMFDYAPDSYKAPILDTRLLCDEAYRTYILLKNSNAEDKFYKKYIGTILQELLESLATDSIAKEILAGRYDTIVSNLKEACNDKNKFESTVRNLRNYLGQRKYYNALVQCLSKKIKGKRNQQEIIHMAELWLCEIYNLGYSKQHVYNVTNEFFTYVDINSADAIDEFFKKFDFKTKKWELLTFADKDLISYISGLQRTIKNDKVIVEEYEFDELKNLVQQPQYRKMYWFFSDLKALQKLRKVGCIKCVGEALDPYVAMQRVQDYIKTLSNFVTNFDNEDKKLYPYIVCLNYIKQRIIIQSPIDCRTRVYSQNYLHNTLKMIGSLKVSRNVFSVLLKVLEYHGDAIAQKSENRYAVSTLWTALETLFIDGQVAGSKGDIVKDALIEIIQRTYIIKRLKYLQIDFLRNIRAYNGDLIKKYNLEDISVFTEMLFDDPQSTRTKEVQATLAHNPLLRTRVYVMVDNDLGKADKIEKFLAKHRNRIGYQIDRIYRVRNFLIHAAQEMDYEDSTVECLHYYVDFVINYIFAKMEAGDAIVDIYDVIEEARGDNTVHKKILSDNPSMAVSRENYLKMLFGPSTNVMEYYMEHIV